MYSNVRKLCLKVGYNGFPYKPVIFVLTQQWRVPLRKNHYKKAITSFGRKRLFAVESGATVRQQHRGNPPVAFAWRARAVLAVLQHRITGWLFNSRSFQIYNV